MNQFNLLAASSVCFALLCPAVAAQAPAVDGEQLEVFLQGSSATELRTLVESQGGSITHDLPIIDAVGAQLTRAQLAKVVSSPKVARFFDDLAISETPEDNPADGDQGCSVAGSLELDIGADSVRWRLYNKDVKPAPLEHLKLTWPRELGKLRNLSLGDKDLDLTLHPASAKDSVQLDLNANPGKALATLSGTQELSVQFSSATGQPLRQRDFEMEATFGDDCVAKLIPGYDNNHQNFYYNAAAGVEDLHRNGVTGRGVTVAVVDSGLWEAPALATDTNGRHRVVARYDAITNTSPDEAFDASGHGTHMTSVIAHNGMVTSGGAPTGAYKGVAPDVYLVAVKAFDVAGQGGFLDIVRAIQWVVDHRKTYNIKVLNLSFSARPRWPYWLDPINQAVMQAWGSGIAVVVAAGNEGPESMTIGSPGNLPFVITVGAVTDSWTPEDKNDDYIPDFSSQGPTPNAHIKPDIVAPGGHITGLTRPGSTLTQEHPEYMLSTGEFVMTGSSQASALVAGIAALLLQLEPDLSPNDLKCKLLTSAQPAINQDGLLAYSPFQQGHGYVNASRAVTLGDTGCGNTDMDIQLEMAGIEHSQGPAIVANDGTASLPGLGEMVSPESSEKGLSQARRWGVKAHIERAAPLALSKSTPRITPPFEWMQLYLHEKARIEKLSRRNPE